MKAPEQAIRERWGKRKANYPYCGCRYCTDVPVLLQLLEDLRRELGAEQLRLNLPGANRLAYHCARAVVRGDIGSRSTISDALLDFLKVGGLDGPFDTPGWIAEYELQAEHEANKAAVAMSGDVTGEYLEDAAGET